MPAITAKGQTTIPKPIRNHLGLKPGDVVEFVVEADGGVRLIAKNLRLADLAGLLPRPKQPVTLQDMDKAVTAGALRRFRRSGFAEAPPQRKARRK
ncbi:MAG TPA: AbrB/MazE/SpoVT family DNA-binding domain-containing protein [Alphaproteobacteria bacterium]